MSGTTLPNLGIVGEQADGLDGWGAAYRQNMRVLDAVTQPAAESITNTPPGGTPAEGTMYICGTSPTGAWAGQANNVALFTAGAWLFLPPKPGWMIFNRATGVEMIYLTSPARWVSVASIIFSSEGDSRYLRLATGGTIFGNLGILALSPAIFLNKSGPAAGNAMVLVAQQGGVDRWHERLGSDEAETGANAGSNYQLLRFSDAGLLLGVPVRIRRSDGAVTLQGESVLFQSVAEQNGITIRGAASGARPSILATGPDANISLVIGPKGTGAIIAQMPNNAASGGNARGANAVDWQTERGAATQVASASWTTISGGRFNTASQNDAVVSGGVSNSSTSFASVVSGGEGNTSNGIYSWVPGGAYATARSLRGRGSWSAGMFATPGDSQALEMVLRRQTTDATLTVLTADNAAPGLLNQLVLPNNCTVTVIFLCTARQTGGSAGTVGDSANWVVAVSGKRGANAAATVASRVLILDSFRDTGAAAWNLGIGADTTNGAMFAQVAGEANKTIRWTARWLGVEVTA